MEFDLQEGVDHYNVYYKQSGETDWHLIDGMLVRSYGTYGRADAVGLKAGEYQFRIAALDAARKEIGTSVAESAIFGVQAHDRSGFAHFNHNQGIGAYNNDGTLKKDARVVYITAKTAKSVCLDVTGAESNLCVGLQTILDAYQKGKETRPLCIRIIGKISIENLDHISSSAEGIQIKGRSGYSDMPITIEGIGEDAVLHGFGLLIRNCTGVELRNFALMYFLDDGLSFDTQNSNCWAHHIDFFYGKPGSAADQKKGDGSLDLKAGTRYMTFSYLHFWDSGKMSLCGMGGDDDNYIAYHHNWFDHTDSRHPRVRNMTVHIWNNYYDGCSKYGAGATTGSSLFMENNYFRNTSKPMLISMQGSDINNSEHKGTFSSEDGGMIKSYGNVFTEKGSTFKYVTWQQNATEFDAYEASSRSEQVPASVKAKQGGSSYNNFDTNASLMYAYTPDAADNVPGIVKTWSGRMHGGDFRWTFNNTLDDADYDVDNALRDAIVSYTSSLQQIIGDVANGDVGTGGGTGGSTETPDIEGNISCHFTGGSPSNNAFSVTGNYSTGKGSVSVNGSTYDTCLKMESATKVVFTTTKAMTLTVIIGESETGKRINVDGVAYQANGNVITVSNLAAGSHTISKKDSCNLYYIRLD
ncbi:MAG: pectate lyase [Paludibacter sp.]|nr:pectate lyase [Bacteroidales bacterium]MCM1069593.1 pectate lyase [Prevotella sp.]MCM1354239.1 pectate lyase [Bacteroides sp.]MCM1443022.1 pectate lyase [Muribaculum sp.]MCM1482313.1 pectate lyase [Paludibacter sp.]